MTKSPIDAAAVRAFLDSIFEEDLHAKRVGSLADATLGVAPCVRMSIGQRGSQRSVARAFLNQR